MNTQVWTSVCHEDMDLIGHVLTLGEVEFRFTNTEGRYPTLELVDAPAAAQALHARAEELLAYERAGDHSETRTYVIGRLRHLAKSLTE